FATRTRRLPTPPLFPYTPLFRSDSPGSPVARGSPFFAHRDETPRLLQAPVRAYTTPRAGLPSVIRRCQSGEPCGTRSIRKVDDRSEEHTSELQSRENLVCRLLLE